MPQQLRRLLIQGMTASTIQGVGLRDKIEALGQEYDIQGQVRNWKGKPLVEVIYQANAEKENLFLEGIRKIIGSMDGVRVEDGKNIFDFDSFQAVREDDLTEMVWGLQGAGKLLVTIEESRQRSKIQAVKMSIPVIIEHISALPGGDPKGTFPLFALEHFLEEPPVDLSPALAEKVSQLHAMCHEANDLISSRGPIPSPILDSILSIATKIQKELP